MVVPQSCGIAAQQSGPECELMLDRHAEAGAAVQKRIANNINNALLLRKFIYVARLPLQESSNSVPAHSDLHHLRGFWWRLSEPKRRIDSPQRMATISMFPVRRRMLTLTVSA
jgi:hypothetical protein